MSSWESQSVSRGSERTSAKAGPAKIHNAKSLSPTATDMDTMTFRKVARHADDSKGGCGVLKIFSTRSGRFGVPPGRAAAVTSTRG